MTEGVKILSAGAVKPALLRVVETFRRDHQIHTEVAFATAPAILGRIGAGEPVDILIAPGAVLEEITQSGKCFARETVTLGRIGIGVFVRDGEPLPRIATVESFKQALLDAETVVYNQASTGAYLEKLFESLGVTASITDKSTRYPDFAAVLEHVHKGRGKEIGLGATTVIAESRSRGIRFAGPLPAEIQNYTSYIAAVHAESTARETVRQFMAYLSSPSAKSLLTAAGIQ